MSRRIAAGAIRPGVSRARILAAPLPALALLAGCAALPPAGPVAPLATHLAGEGPVAQCARFLAGLDGAVDRAGVADPEAARVPGFPYLRVSRLLDRGVKPAPGSPAFPAWVDAMARLDREARAGEVANLPAAARRGAWRAPFGAAPLEEVARDCGARLRDRDLATAAGRTRLAAAAVVPPSYRTVGRVLGLYPLTAIPFAAGIARYHAETEAAFHGPLPALPVHGTLVRFRPRTTANPAEARALLARSPVDGLGLVRPVPADRERLFAAFAPVWEVDVAGDDDRIGTPYWRAASVPGVDVSRPVVFRRLSHTRVNGRLLLQLNYTVWFPARPRTGPLDLLGGRLDGITWRVTLSPDGRPLLYDTMHNCGCYHMFLPGPGLVLRASSRDEPEPPLVPQTVAAGPGRIVIRIAHRTHYVRRAYRAPGPFAGETYLLRDHGALRSLPVPGGGRRGLFGPDGLVRGTERRERWLFWPMGVASAGAMRAWGHHAIAFVGRRHFDDPDLVDRFFRATRRPIEAPCRSPLAGEPRRRQGPGEDSRASPDCASLHPGYEAANRGPL